MTSGMRSGSPKAAGRSWRALSPREKIEQTAYDLFSRHGIRAVGVDSIVERSGVAKMTLYRHYESKDALALAFLDRRWELFSRGWQSAVEDLDSPPREAILGLFDILERWFLSKDYAGCPVVKALFESENRADTIRQAAIRYFGGVRGFLATLAKRADVKDPETFAAQLHMIVWGAIVAASAGEPGAARAAKGLAAALLQSEERRGRPPGRKPR